MAVQTYPRLRMHALVEQDCELCTKHYWQSGSILNTCAGCGVMHEGHATALCYHCEVEEDCAPIAKPCGCRLPLAPDDEAHVTLCAAHQAADQVLESSLVTTQATLKELTTQRCRLRRC